MGTRREGPLNPGEIDRVYRSASSRSGAGGTAELSWPTRGGAGACRGSEENLGPSTARRAGGDTPEPTRQLHSSQDTRQTYQGFRPAAAPVAAPPSVSSSSEIFADATQFHRTRWGGKEDEGGAHQGSVQAHGVGICCAAAQPEPVRVGARGWGGAAVREGCTESGALRATTSQRPAGASGRRAAEGIHSSARQPSMRAHCRPARSRTVNGRAPHGVAVAALTLVSPRPSLPAALPLDAAARLAYFLYGRWRAVVSWGRR
jgi:hypothetical protein